MTRHGGGALLATVALLAACGDNTQTTQMEIGGSAAGTLELMPGGSAEARFVARWRSTNGEQVVFASLLGPKFSRPVRRTFTLSLPSGQDLSGVSSTGGDIPLKGNASCVDDPCMMEAVGTILYEDLQDMDEPAETDSLRWSVIVTVEPRYAQVKVSDLSVEGLEDDAGTSDE